MRRVLLSVAMLAAGTGLVGCAGDAHVGPRADARNGGTLRVTVFPGAFDSIDPDFGYKPMSYALLDATCARLFTTQGFRVVPEVATGYPKVSRDAKTYAFTLRDDFRFSNGAPVEASAFARQINRVLSPAMRSPGAPYVQDIVGADDVLAGKRASARGIVAKGRRLVVTFTRAVPDFVARTTMSFFCAVPPTLPADREGALVFPGAGPYYVAKHVRGRTLVLERNRFYRGTRPHHVDRFVADFVPTKPNEVLDRIERGQADLGWAPGPYYFDPERKLVQKYGINRSQYFIKPGLTLEAFALNTSRPLFRNNPKLRRAVNFAVDRAALQRVGGSLAGQLTDQYLPPTFPGFEDAHIYPLSHPDLAKARALARGNLRSGKAVLYIIDNPERIPLGQILKKNLAKIGLAVEIKAIPPSAYFERIGIRDEPYDIAWFPWAPDYPDPYTYINTLLDGRGIRPAGNFNFAQFDSSRYNGLMDRAARLRGDARYRAYGDLDVQLARDAAPMVSYAYAKDPTLVSKRVGCTPEAFVLVGACLKKRR